MLTAREPIVDIRAFKNRNFGVGCLISFCVGIGLYGLTYIYPRYLAEVRGYSALMIGETMFVSGVTMFLMAPIVGRLMQKIDMRLIIARGLVIFALGSYQMTWITRDYDFYELLVPQILRGVGMMCAMVPTNNIALGTLAADRVKNASGLFNLTRNLGGAVGLAVINEVLNDRTDLHISRLAGSRHLGQHHGDRDAQHFTQRLQGMGDAALMAMKQLSQIVHRQAVVMGYGDAFFMLTLFYVGLSAAGHAPEETESERGRGRRALKSRAKLVALAGGEAAPDQRDAGHEQQPQHDVAKIPVTERVIGARTEPRAADRRRCYQQSEPHRLARDQAGASLRDQRRSQDRPVEGLEDAAPLILAPAAHARPQNGNGTRQAREAAEHAAGKSDCGVGDFPADAQGHGCALEIKRGRKHQKQDADAELEVARIGIGNQQSAERHAG